MREKLGEGGITSCESEIESREHVGERDNE